jgi:hypothetical protein
MTPGPPAAGQGRRIPRTAAVSCSRLLGGDRGRLSLRGAFVLRWIEVRYEGHTKVSKALQQAW